MDAAAVLEQHRAVGLLRAELAALGEGEEADFVMRVALEQREQHARRAAAAATAACGAASGARESTRALARARSRAVPRRAVPHR